MSVAVLATRHGGVGKINDAITERSPGEAYEQKREGSVSRGVDAAIYPAGCATSIEVSGIPHRQLRLKVGTPVMILRNRNAAGGMCNGSKSIVRRIRTRCGEV